MKVLFGNEFGAGFGHHARLLGLEAALRQIGMPLQSHYVLQPHDCANVPVESGRSVQAAQELVAESTHALYQSGILQHRFAARWLQHKDILTPRLRMWRQVLKSYKPDLVVAELAPSLTLAAFGKVACLATGNGYSIPPIMGNRCIPFR